MLKKFLLIMVAMMATMSLAFADVDVNKADQAALDSVRGIGPAMSKTILDERKKGGNFKDWEDLQARVKGIGDKSSEKFSQAGLTVNGTPKPGMKAVAKKEPVAASAKAKTDEMKK
jgi:competence protein ComEA